MVLVDDEGGNAAALAAMPPPPSIVQQSSHTVGSSHQTNAFPPNLGGFGSMAVPQPAQGLGSANPWPRSDEGGQAAGDDGSRLMSTYANATATATVTATATETATRRSTKIEVRCPKTEILLILLVARIPEPCHFDAAPDPFIFFLAAPAPTYRTYLLHAWVSWGSCQARSRVP